MKELKGVMIEFDAELANLKARRNRYFAATSGPEKSKELDRILEDQKTLRKIANNIAELLGSISDSKTITLREGEGP